MMKFDRQTNPLMDIIRLLVPGEHPPMGIVTATMYYLALN